MKDIRLCAFACLMLLASHGHAESLSLDDVLNNVMATHPGVAAVEHAADAARADAAQAKMPSNPTLSLEVENIAGSGEFSGTDAAEYTVLLSQELELGGKRRKRRAAADLEAELAMHEAVMSRRALRADASKAYYTLLAAQERLELAKRLSAMAAEVVEQAEKRVKAGGSSPLESTKAKLEAAQLRVELRNAEQGLLAAQRNLAGYWGDTEGGQLVVEGELGVLTQPPAFSEQLAAMEKHPAWTSLEMREQLLAQQISIARAERIPNVELGAGVRQEDASGDHALLFEAAFPLPLINRNQGSRKSAAARARQGAAEAEVARIDMKMQLADADSAVRKAYTAAIAVEEELLPAARKAFQIAEQGYAQGRFSALDLLDAERSLFEQEINYIELLETYHHSWMDLQQLISKEQEL